MPLQATLFPEQFRVRQLPDLHCCPCRHRFLHCPQWLKFEERLAQVVPQSTVPVGQEHELFLQTALFGQSFPHRPQCSVLVERSTQSPLQLVLPLGH